MTKAKAKTTITTTVEAIEKAVKRVMRRERGLRRYRRRRIQRTPAQQQRARLQAIKYAAQRKERVKLEHRRSVAFRRLLKALEEYLYLERMWEQYRAGWRSSRMGGYSRPNPVYGRRNAFNKRTVFRFARRQDPGKVKGKGN